MRCNDSNFAEEKIIFTNINNDCGKKSADRINCTQKAFAISEKRILKQSETRQNEISQRR